MKILTVHGYTAEGELDPLAPTTLEQGAEKAEVAFCGFGMTVIYRDGGESTLGIILTELFVEIEPIHVVVVYSPLMEVAKTEQFRCEGGELIQKLNDCIGTMVS